MTLCVGGVNRERLCALILMQNPLCEYTERVWQCLINKRMRVILQKLIYKLPCATLAENISGVITPIACNWGPTVSNQLDGLICKASRLSLYERIKVVAIAHRGLGSHG